MSTSLQVVTQAPVRTLVTLDQVKERLGITGSGIDDILNSLISEASATIETHCHRVFARQDYRQTDRIDYTSASFVCHMRPIEQPTKITIRGQAQDVANFEIDAGNGIVWPKPGFNVVSASWYASVPSEPFGGKVEVEFAAGFGTMPQDCPIDVQSACLDLVTAFFRSRKRDPGVSSAKLDGVGAETYATTGGANGTQPSAYAGLPQGVVTKLTDYVIKELGV